MPFYLLTTCKKNFDPSIEENGEANVVIDGELCRLRITEPLSWEKNRGNQGSKSISAERERE